MDLSPADQLLISQSISQGITFLLTLALILFLFHSRPSEEN